MRRYVAFLAASLAAAACGARSQEGALLKREKTVALPGVEGRFDHFAADVAGNRLFLAALGNNTLEVLDAKQGRLLKSVRGMREPQGVACAPELNRVFVGNGEGGTLDLLDGRSFERVGRVSGLDDADNVRYDAGARRVWVGYGGGALCEVDPVAGTRVRTVPLAAHPESFQLEQNGPRIWVNVPGAGQIAVVDRKQAKVVATWPVKGARANFPMAVDEDGHRLFIGCREPARLLVYDTGSGKQVVSVGIVGDTDDLFYDAPRKRLYVIGGGGAVTVLRQRDPDHYEALGTLPTAPGARTGFWVPAWGRLFVAVPHRGGQAAEVRAFTP